MTPFLSRTVLGAPCLELVSLGYRVKCWQDWFLQRLWGPYSVSSSCLPPLAYGPLHHHMASPSHIPALPLVIPLRAHLDKPGWHSYLKVLNLITPAKSHMPLWSTTLTGSRYRRQTWRGGGCSSTYHKYKFETPGFWRAFIYDVTLLSLLQNSHLPLGQLLCLQKL